jgi:hypothetical protein
MVEARFLNREKVLLDCVRYLLAARIRRSYVSCWLAALT